MNVPVCGIAAAELDVVVLVLLDAGSLLFPHAVLVASAKTAPAANAASCLIVVNLM